MLKSLIDDLSTLFMMRSLLFHTKFLRKYFVLTENSSSYEENLIAKDLRVNKSNNNNELERESLRANGTCSNIIKQEEEREEQMASIRR